MKKESPKKTSTALAKQAGPQRQYRTGKRAITQELAAAFAEVLLSDLSHTVQSASLEVGLNPWTVRDAISRYNIDKCLSLADEEICEVLFRAKAEHVKQIRAAGYISAGRGNRAGTSWAQWQLEVQDPNEHRRKTEAAVELSGKDGGPIETQSAVQYVVHVPDEEKEE